MTTDAVSMNVALGIKLVILAAFMISVQDAAFKLFTGDLTLWQIFALRGLVALPMLLLLAGMRGRGRMSVSEAYSFWPLMRSLCLTLAFVVFYAVLPFISLSTAGAGIYMAPIFVAILSAFVIGERVSRWGWIGVFMGFAGVLVMLQPGTDAFSIFAVMPLLSAAFYAVGHIITRTRCQNVAVEAMSLSLNTLMSLAGVLISIGLLLWTPNSELTEAYPYILGNWSNVDLQNGLFVVLLAVFAVLIGMALAGAYQAAPPATVATFEYSYLVFVAAWDILFFAIAPTLISVTGMVMIVAAGILVMRGGK